MVSRPVPLNSIDDAFTKILIEELAHPDRIADLGSESSFDTNNTETQWETIANARVPADPGSEMLEIDNAPIAIDSPQAAANAQKHWQLRVIYQDGRECTLPLEDKPITIGRGRDNAITVKCDRVSRQHARIQLDARGPRVDDLNSCNGILVNGIKVPAAYLKPGDELKIGSVVIHMNLAE